MIRKLGCLLVILIVVPQGYAQQNLRLWYEKPANQWEETLPLGNGRIGAMPDGAVGQETIVLNDISLWSGAPQDADDPDAIKHLPRIRQLLMEGKNHQAEALMYETFVSKGAGSGYGQGANVPYGSYQVLGHLRLNYDLPKNAEHYSRELNLENAVARTTFDLDGVTYQREYLTSFPDDVIAIELSASEPGRISFTLDMDRPERFETTIQDRELIMRGQLNDGSGGPGMRYAARVKVLPRGGILSTEDNSLKLSKANSALILISVGTDYKNTEFETHLEKLLEKASKKSYSSIRKDHIDRYQGLFKRVAVDFGSNPQAEALTTPQRLDAFAEIQDDPGLAELYFQYGRYLAISSTRPGGLPPNLQGLWGNEVQLPWNGDYHLNINFQMNHWPVHVTNLAPLHQPYHELIASLVEPGEKTAKTYYDGDGWVAHVITNIWGYTSPGEHPSWGSTNSGSGWVAQMLWRHYAFTGDKEYLKEIYPIIKGAAEFYNSTFLHLPDKDWLVTAPSNSPENAFYLPSGERVNVTMAPTIDNQIIRTLFKNVIAASQILEIDSKYRRELQERVQKLPPNRIGSDGRLLEWIEEYKEAEPHHRHVSHLWGLYPGTEISPINTPDLAEAARKTLEARGDGGTGWSLAWKINFWARLGDGDRAFKLLANLLKPVMGSSVNMSTGGGTYPNLFCAHPPFQIDGNFGGTAGIAEMLIQSHEGFVNFLPALPSAWQTGSFSGLRVRGGGQADISWKEGRITEASLTADSAQTFKIKIPKGITSYSTGSVKKDLKGQEYLSIDLKKGEQLKLH